MNPPHRTPSLRRTSLGSGAWAGEPLPPTSIHTARANLMRAGYLWAGIGLLATVALAWLLT